MAETSTQALIEGALAYPGKVMGRIMVPDEALRLIRLLAAELARLSTPPEGSNGSSRDHAPSVCSALDGIFARPIETCPTEDGKWYLASVLGLVWFQAAYDADDDTWRTFNGYAEKDRSQRGEAWVFRPKYWLPVPLLADGPKGQDANEEAATRSEAQRRDSPSSPPHPTSEDS